MSLQEELLKRRKTLHPTDTLVTTPSGKQFIEHRTGQLEQLQTSSYGFVVDNKPDIEVACILDNFLFFGSQDAVSEANILKYKFTHILSVGIQMAATISEPHKLEMIFIPCLDLPETQLFNDNGTGFAQQAVIAISDMLKATSEQARILVHCNAGVSRSACVVICYLMMHCGLCFDEAYALVKQKRPAIQPNIGFMRQMRQFSNCKS